ncbi:C39 family peptidase [Dactylosporangium roseum]|uniref:C39 family peptidase n=1 Tax=Dactylosporangium roseum TaxID=47989 RepID=A0ABY5YZ64_9ACTN|nr:C39 family peptidase [Dactylosporangium roseum]UWZ34153.1 C39 family peptidase [Dactylosporangium roseum]
MQPRPDHKKFRHAPPRRSYPALLGSAALVVVAAATAALLNQTQGPADAHDSAAAALARAAVVAGNGPAKEAPPSQAPTAAASNAPAQKVVDYDFQFQPNYYYCGPASTRIALTSNGVNLSQDEIARKLGTTVSGTDSANDTTRALNSVLGKDVYQTRTIPGQKATDAEAGQLRQDVVRALSGGRAIVANIVGGARDAGGVWHEFPGGHYVTIVGYRDHGGTVQIADPSGMFGPRTYWMSTGAMANWVAARGYSA